MIYILEGIDKNGKTTLAKKLAKKLGCNVEKFSAPGRNAYREYSEFLDSANPRKNYVVDRYCHGELCYGPELRGKSQVTFEDVRFLELRLLTHGCVGIYCFTDVNHTIENMQICDELSTKPSHVIGLKERYENLLEESSILRWFRYDYRDEGSSSFSNLMLALKERSFTTMTQATNWLGTTDGPRVLFVLDRKNERLSRLENRHILDSTSGRFMLRSIYKKIGTRLNKLAFTNSDKLNTVLLDRVKPLHVVACGKNSEAVLRSTGLKFSRVVHPQFAKRFYGKDAILRYQRELNGVFI